MNFKDLNPQQKEAVEYGDGPLLIVAGAGSGKTKTLTSRLLNLLKNGAEPSSIIAITFTNKAADEMRNRINLQLTTNNRQQKANNYQPFIGTFHSLGARILRENGKFFGRTIGFSIFDSDDSLRIIKSIIKNFNLDTKKYSAPQLQRKFSAIKSELVDLNNGLVDGYDVTIKALFNEYELALKNNNAFDFDDLIEKVVRLFRENKVVLKKYQKQIKYVLVDEYQDINTAQYYFIRMLSQHHNNINVVGDDQQSIYKFRFSDFRNFLNFDRDWPGAKIVLLEQNYRSTGNIIKAASAVVSNNKNQRPKTLWTENSDGELIKVIEHKNSDREASYVATLLNSKLNFSHNKPKSVGILYRTNSQSRAIEQALIGNNIKYRIFGGPSFYERKEIKDIIAGLRYGLNPKDSVSLERLEKNFNKKIYLEFKNNLPQKSKNISPLEVIGYIIKTSNYFEFLEKTFLNFKERRENIEELMNFAANFNNLGDFLERISLLGPLDKNDLTKTVDARVNLMTIHLAKGLEFDEVFVLGCNEGLLPHQMSYSSSDEIEEERRLMYVAMTRAKNNLYLNFYNLPSRFLYEIPPQFIEFIGSQSLDDEARYIELN